MPSLKPAAPARPSRSRSTLLAAALTLAAASAHAAPHGILWARGHRPPATDGTGNLQYYGGPVIAHAKVYAVFWGDKVSAQTRQKIGPYFAGFLDSGYMDWLSEYDTNIPAVDGRPGTKQHIGRGSFGGAVTIEAANRSKSLTDADVQRELDGQIAAGKLPPPTPDSLYMVYFPNGVNISIDGQRSCLSFCAYHEGFQRADGASVFYGVMPVCSWTCGIGDAFASLCVASSHEALEAVTDPFPTPGSSPAYPQAWNTSGGQEIADLCQGGSSSVPGAGVVTDLWDNASSSCKSGPWTKALAGATPETAALRAVDGVAVPAAAEGTPDLGRGRPWTLPTSNW